ncbi:MAG: 4Fe-4S dicluster domain-containing protein [Deltaproteobacteria bacterium]|nr:MAG: 4Fe-4S dicluster domain-containing protein [Deltaproteobacteria bacterium]
MSDGKTPETVSRRSFLHACFGAAGAMVLFEPGEALASTYVPGDHYWAYVVDLTKCIGCGACVRACKAENAVPDGFFRTWVERYTFLDDGEVLVDSPDGALNGFASDPDVPPERVAKSFFVPKICNHCTSSPCVQVCPVGASYETKDGVVLVDKSYCIGCGYCIQACPYGCRFMNPVGTADKCTLCLHRLTRGQAPACVAACPVGARACGDLKDPNDPVRRELETRRHGVLKPELGTHPKCYYLGLDQEVL